MVLLLLRVVHRPSRQVHVVHEHDGDVIVGGRRDGPEQRVGRRAVRVRAVVRIFR